MIISKHVDALEKKSGQLSDFSQFFWEMSQAIKRIEIIKKRASVDSCIFSCWNFYNFLHNSICWFSLYWIIPPHSSNTDVWSQCRLWNVMNSFMEMEVFPFFFFIRPPDITGVDDLILWLMRYQSIGNKDVNVLEDTMADEISLAILFFFSYLFNDLHLQSHTRKFIFTKTYFLEWGKQNRQQQQIFFTNIAQKTAR